MAQMGRPPLPPDKRRTETLRVRLSKDELATLGDAADGKPIGEWARERLIAAAVRAARRTR